LQKWFVRFDYNSINVGTRAAHFTEILSIKDPCWKALLITWCGWTHLHINKKTTRQANGQRRERAISAPILLFPLSFFIDYHEEM
jgi:hypothetical protein